MGHRTLTCNSASWAGSHLVMQCLVFSSFYIEFDFYTNVEWSSDDYINVKDFSVKLL